MINPDLRHPNQVEAGERLTCFLRKYYDLQCALGEMEYEVGEALNVALPCEVASRTHVLVTPDTEAFITRDAMGSILKIEFVYDFKDAPAV